MKRFAFVAALASLLGCRTGPSAPAARPDTTHAERPIEELEEEALRDLAAIDRRIALRARVVPSEEDLRRVAMAAVLREDATVAVVGGRIDAFSFDARARGLEAIRRKLPRALFARSEASAAEGPLLGWLIEGEEARLDEERAVPRSASALVRAIVETWEAPRDTREVAEVDRWAARRLRELREAMAGPEPLLDVVRARELDDALDALERIVGVPGFTSAMQELVRLREALEAIAARPAPAGRTDWPAVARRIQTHLGSALAPDDLARDLAASAAALRAQADKAIAAAGVRRDALGEHEKERFAASACLDAIPGSRLRSMTAPPEREPACLLRHLVAGADSEETRALALVAMHDHVVVAQWALDAARGTTTLAEAEARHRLFVPIRPDTRARFERAALARSVAAIGAGLAARILSEGDPRLRAAKWSTLGDVPFDVARAQLREKN